MKRKTPFDVGKKTWAAAISFVGPIRMLAAEGLNA